MTKTGASTTSKTIPLLFFRVKDITETNEVLLTGQHNSHIIDMFRHIKIHLAHAMIDPKCFL